LKKGDGLFWERDDDMLMTRHNEELFMEDDLQPETGERLQEMPQNMVLAHSYVPWQTYDQAFSPREALMKGTLFPELWGVYPIPE
jgi:hypothetical protein